MGKVLMSEDMREQPQIEQGVGQGIPVTDKKRIPESSVGKKADQKHKPRDPGKGEYHRGIKGDLFHERLLSLFSSYESYHSRRKMQSRSHRESGGNP